MSETLLNDMIARLDQRMQAEGSRGRIVSVNNDVGSINWVSGLSDPGEMIGCGMYQELRRLDGETDAAYAARLPALLAQLPAHHRVKIETAMKDAAIRRASLDTTGGKVAVMVAGEPAWHRLGVNVESAVNSRQAIDLSGLNWQMSKRPLSVQLANGTYQEIDSFAVVRDDSEAVLGVVGGRYKIIQNAQAFEFLDTVLDEFGAKYHTAGSLYGGAKVWMQAELPKQSFEVVRGDEVQAFATWTNTNDGSGRAWCYPTTNRIVCANTFRTASKERSKGLGIRHVGDVRASINDARTALGVAVREIEDFKEHAEVMVREPIDAPAFFKDLLDAILEISQVEANAGADVLAASLRVSEIERELARKRIQRQIEHREALLNDMIERYDSERCGVGGIRGTKWAAFNAVTESFDHRKPRREVGSEQDRLSRRFESVLDGDADQVKQTAYQMLTMKA